MMKHKLGLGVLTLLLLSGCATTGWVNVQGPQAPITFQMPGPAQTQKQTVNTAIGPIDVVFYTCSLDGFSFVASFNDYPAAALEGRTVAELLDGAREGAVGNIQGKLLSELLIHLGTADGRELRIETSDHEHTVVARFYFSQGRLYQMIVVAPKAQAFHPRISQFLNSLVIE